MRGTDRSSQSRAAEIRQRRTQKTQDRVTRAVDHSRRPVATPPVMTRGSMAGVGARKKAKTGNARRQYYYALNTPGAELRIPALPIFHFGWRLASGCLAVLLIAALWAMWNTSLFQVESVRVVGSKRISAKEINEALQLEGISVISLIPDQIKQDVLAAYPDFSSVSVSVGLPAGVTVQVKEREPVLAWQKSDQLLWIDQDGVAFPARGDMPNLLTIQAEGDPPAQASQATTDATANDQTAQGDQVAPADETPKVFISPEMIASIKKLEGQPPAGTAILYNPNYGLGWNDPGGWKVYFGMKIDDMDLKLQQYRVIVDTLTKRNVHPVMISVEFTHAPFYRLEQ